MPLYKRVFPKWHEDTWKQDETDEVVMEEEAEIDAQVWKPNANIN